MREVETLSGRNINNIKCVDDAVLTAESVEKLHALVNEVNAASEEKGLRINRDTTE